MRRRPYLRTSCVADRYADKRCERTAEFEGGLITLRRRNDGSILVSLHNLDDNVRVTLAPRHLVVTL